MGSGLSHRADLVVLRRDETTCSSPSRWGEERASGLIHLRVCESRWNEWYTGP